MAKIKLPNFFVSDEAILQAIRELGRSTYTVPLYHKLKEMGYSMSIGRLHVRLDKLQRNLLVFSRYEDGGPERGGKQKRFVGLAFNDD